MAKQQKLKKQPEARNQVTQKKRQATQSNAAAQKQTGKTRRFFTVAICVIVALGLMLPVTGLGFASCSGCLNRTENNQSSS